MSMSSNEQTLYDKLIQIRSELIENANVLEEGLDKKLDRTSKAYIDAVNKNCKYILSRSNYKAIMAIDRYEKHKEKSDEKKDNYGFIETY